MTALYVFATVPPCVDSRQAMCRLSGSQAGAHRPARVVDYRARPLKLPRQLGTFDRPVAERIRAWGVMGTVPRVVAAGLVLFTVLYVVVLADPVVDIGNWRTTNFGSAIDNPGAFLFTLLDAVTFAALLFI